MDYRLLVKRLDVPAGFSPPTRLLAAEFPFWNVWFSNRELPDE